MIIQPIKTSLSGSLVTEISLPRVEQPNNSQNYRNKQFSTPFQFNSLIQTQGPNDFNCFPPITTFNTLVSCTPSQPLHLPPTSENSFTIYPTAIFPAIAQQVIQPNVSEKLNHFPIWSCHGSHGFQPRTEIQTDRTPFEHNFNLQTTNKRFIKFPHIAISIFNGNPLKCHEWINNFFIFLLQNYSCGPAY